jgi:hypothetical protein
LSEKFPHGYKDRFKKGLTISTVFVAGAVTAAVVIRYRNGIGINEAIWAIPVDVLRERVQPGSQFILNTPKGEFYVTKVPIRGGQKLQLMN